MQSAGKSPGAFLFYNSKPRSAKRYDITINNSNIYMRRKFTVIQLLLWLIAICSACTGRSYTVPSGNMANTIEPGDHVNVTRARSFNVNDIVVFNILADDYNSPSEEEPGTYKKSWQQWISRLVAVSGDTLEIKQGNLYVNGRLQPLPPDALGMYDVRSTVAIDDFPGEDDDFALGPQLIHRDGDTLLYRVELTARQAAEYEQRRPAVLEVKKVLEEKHNPSAMSPLATNCGACAWSLDFYGPVRIPIQDETIVVDSSNYRLYQQVPDIKMGSQVINEKLYFVMGDNRHGAMDSRFNGFISHSKMHGIVK